MPYAAVSVNVGEALEADGEPLQELIDDLAHITHDEAAEHYGVNTRCHFREFAAERGDRQAFAEFLDQVKWPERDSYLDHWDKATHGRVVAIVHWFEIEQGRMN